MLDQSFPLRRGSLLLECHGEWTRTENRISQRLVNLFIDKALSIINRCVQKTIERYRNRRKYWSTARCTLAQTENGMWVSKIERGPHFLPLVFSGSNPPPPPFLSYQGQFSISITLSSPCVTGSIYTVPKIQFMYFQKMNFQNRSTYLAGAK